MASVFIKVPVKEQFPSKCWDCVHARATWSEALEKKGMTGCCYPERYGDGRPRLIFEMTDLVEYNEGWIYGARKPLDRSESTCLGSGRTINCQPIVVNVTRCTKYEQDK